MGALASSTAGSSGTPLWRFSLTYYARPQVPAACLELQDDCGADVNVLLLALWLASQGRAVSVSDMRAIADLSLPWQKAVVAPLRTVRRALKADHTLVDAKTAEPFRAKIKAMELEAEHLQQDALYAWAQALPAAAKSNRDAAASTNIKSYSDYLGRTFPAPAVEALLSAFHEVAAI